MRKAQAIAALRAQRAATLGQLAALDDRAWERPCLPSWRVRDVVAHLSAIDAAAVTGRLLPLLRGASSREDVERWNDRAVSALDAPGPAALLEDLRRGGERLAGLAQRLPAAAWRAPVRTVFGRHPVAFLAARRVHDEWVHSVDIARATDERIVDVPCPDVLATAVLDALPVLQLPALRVRTGVVRLVVGTGPELDLGAHTPRRTWSIDFARRQFGERVVAAPDATIRLHGAALALLVERRAADGYGSVEVDGDAELAEAVLDGLAAV